MGRRLKDIDAAERAFRIRTFLWSALTVPMGLLVGRFVADQSGLGGAWPILASVGGAVGLPIFICFVALRILDYSGRAAGQLYNPSGTMPARRGYSREESLVMRGRYQEAAAAYQSACDELPADPEPRLRLARLLRDELGRPEQAIEWFRAAAAADGRTPEIERYAARSIVEICTGPLGNPYRALRELARLADEHRGRPLGDWARQTLREMKQRLYAR